MELYVTYRQIAVFQSGLANPFNDWRDAHVRQGFVWRPGSVSFATFDDGRLAVIVERSGAPPGRKARRAILVPFTVPRRGWVEIATITESQDVSLEPGEYGLTFEHGLTEDGKMWCRLRWQLVDRPVEPAILLADSELEPLKPLLMDADPATA
jgi:hypothetical protein